MDSFEFFENKEFTQKWKGKAGIYIIENPLFTRFVGYPVYKVGYARHSLYTRISNYRTAYGLTPFKIHAIYAVPEKVFKARVNFANLTERILQETARKYGEYAGIGEWFKNIQVLLNILKAIQTKYLEKYATLAPNWEIYTHQPLGDSINNIDLVSEEEIQGTFKDLIAYKHTRSRDNDTERETEDADAYELVAIGKRNQAEKQVQPPKKTPTTGTTPKTRQKASKKPTKLYDKDNNVLIHDGTKADDYIGEKVRKYFPRGRDAQGNTYKAGYYDGEVIDYKVNEKNKVYPVRFVLQFPDGLSEVRSDNLVQIIENYKEEYIF